MRSHDVILALADFHVVGGICPLDDLAHAFVRHELRLVGEVFRAPGLTVARVQGVGKHLYRFEGPAACVKIPVLIQRPIHRPKMVFGNHAPHALDRRNCRSHAGFGVEAVGASTSAGVA